MFDQGLNVTADMTADKARSMLLEEKRKAGEEGFGSIDQVAVWES